MNFASNGDQADGYLAVPASGSGPGVLVLQEWWGLVPQLRSVADRLAAEGFVALAPDLYHGDIAEHDEMDRAVAPHDLAADGSRRAATWAGAVDYLRAHPSVSHDQIGALGYCMGGMLTLLVATQQGDKFGAVAPYYGVPLGDGPDWSNLTAPVRGHFAEHDDFFPPAAIKELEQKLRGMGKDVEFEVHAGTGHAFCNEENPLGTHDAVLTDKCWASTIEFLRERLS